MNPHAISINKNSSQTIFINQKRPESSLIVPQASCRVGYSVTGLQLHFFIKNEFVSCIHRQHMLPVYQDSCVEFFCSPDLRIGYINFEFNALGFCLAAFRKSRHEILWEFSPELISQLNIASSLPDNSTEILPIAINWQLQVSIPFTIFQTCFGNIHFSSVWRGNFYKCGDKTKYPHWLSWAPVKELNFHSPQEFGFLQFIE